MPKTAWSLRLRAARERSAQRSVRSMARSMRRSSEAARGELLATEEARRAVTITLIADVASAYLLLKDLDNRYEISRRTLGAREESTAIVQARFDKGVVPLLDVNQAQIEEADAAATLAQVRRQDGQTENLLNVLIGRNPQRVLRGLELVESLGVIARLFVSLFGLRGVVRLRVVLDRGVSV